MKEIKIEHLGYLLKQAKANDKPQPIFFLGAGASRSGKIPLASEIVKKILDDYSDNPFISDLSSDQRTYAKLMGCLLPNQRDELLKKYIADAKINVTHIYLAQLISKGYVDYVLTVNFDNLVLRALALYNIFPSTYDLAILKDFTTSTFKEKSVVYLHGQHHGLWLLNTSEEMDKVKNTVPRIFDTIKNQRPWVFIGYRGDDPIFEHVRNLGRFDNGLYWVAFNDENPSENIQCFLADPNTNAFIIKGYDSDSFMVKLNNELDLDQPVIVDKPFSALKIMLEEIVDIDEQEHFKGVKERLDIAKRQVGDAISQFEQGFKELLTNIEENRIDILKKEIINLLITEKFELAHISEIEKKVRDTHDNEASSLLAGLFSDWGVSLGNQAISKEGEIAEELFQKSFEKFQKAIEIKPDIHEAYNNWGINLGSLARLKKGREAEDLYHQSFEKYRKAIQIKPDKDQAFYNWGNELGNLAMIREGKEAENLYRQSFELYSKAIDINPNNHKVYYNWGNYLANLAKNKEGKDSESLYSLSIEKFRSAIQLKPDNYFSYINLGNSLCNLARFKEEEEAEDLFCQSFENYRMAIEIMPENFNAYNNWGNALGDLAKVKKGKEAEDLLYQSFEKYRKAIEIKPDDKSVYYNWGNHLVELAKIKSEKEAEDLYYQSFDKYRKATELMPEFYDAFNNWGNSIFDLAGTKEGKEADYLYKQSIRKYQKAIEINTNAHEAYNNLGNSLLFLAKMKEGKEAEDLYKQSFEQFQKAISNGGSSYNIACLYAIKGIKKEALYYLDLSLSKAEIEVSFVEQDDDWKEYLNDLEFKDIINKYNLSGRKT